MATKKKKKSKKERSILEKEINSGSIPKIV